MPMTAALTSALSRLEQVRTGPVVRGREGVPVAEAALKHVIYRVCRRVGLPELSWHTLRHPSPRTQHASG